MQVIRRTEGNCCGGCIEITLKLGYNDLAKAGYRYFGELMKASEQDVITAIKKAVNPVRKPRVKKVAVVEPAFATVLPAEVLE